MQTRSPTSPTGTAGSKAVDGAVDIFAGRDCFVRRVVQSLNSPFFPLNPAPHIGAEPGRAKGESLLSPARVQPLYVGREERGVQGLDYTSGGSANEVLNGV